MDKFSNMIEVLAEKDEDQEAYAEIQEEDYLPGANDDDEDMPDPQRSRWRSVLIYFFFLIKLISKLARISVMILYDTWLLLNVSVSWWVVSKVLWDMT